MNIKFEPTLERSSVPDTAGTDHRRKPYESPRLQDWGSLLELTSGPLSDITDADFNGGSGGV
jgi:hypothetical protein